MEKELNKLYREIAETVNEMIPEEWEKFYFYAQISETVPSKINSVFKHFGGVGEYNIKVKLGE